MSLPTEREAQHELMTGPLHTLEGIRPRVLVEVARRTKRELSPASLDLILGQALYSERMRLKRDRGNVFTKKRLKADRAMWNQIQSGLLQSPAQQDRGKLLDLVLRHYAEEIGGHFDPKVYRLTTRVVPLFFNWLLNAASVKTFNPFKQTEYLRDVIRIRGHVDHLKSLSQKGTILMVPTHQSNIDSILIGYVIYLMGLPPFAYGAGLNLFSNPVLSYFMGHLGAYTVDRQKNNEIYKAALKNYSTVILREGVHSIFFPGGGRARSGALESKLKLGLLGTALDAQLENLRGGKPNPNVYVVPMVMSYHFVLEAASLIEDYLADAGKHRFIMTDDESWQPTKILDFFWKFFSSQNGVTVRIGKPMDVFGNFVDEEGRSIGPNGTVIDPAKWLSTGGVLQPEPRRDQEYTRELGAKLVGRYSKENTVLTSHLAAFSFFEALRARYKDLDLYRFLRLSLAQRSLAYDDFLARAEEYHRRVLDMEKRGELHLSEDLRTSDTRKWVEDGVKQLGFLHESAVLKVGDGTIFTEDMNLLYYYRNRLSGYGLSLLADQGWMRRKPGQNDPKGFLA